ncbi:phage major capsid protein [Mycobacteroides chelonae]|uniref:phage major capsid protein n=1 Tax=Mycobacteroides chelonae TaxID=1774 RepID=UPI002351E7DD|nr:phage major capsid protein [Mycobacteroides chelonae]
MRPRSARPRRRAGIQRYAAISGAQQALSQLHRSISMSLTTASGGAILTPEQIGELVIRPLNQLSVAMQTGNVVPITAPSLRVPVVTADTAAAWTAEGAEIAVSDPALAEIDIVPKKLAALTVISNELAADTSPAALKVVGDSIVRDLQRKIDAAYFGNTVTNGPSGLLSIASTAVDAGDTWANLDWAEQAKSIAEQHNSVVGAFVCSPNTALKLATIKEYGTAGSNRALLQADPTTPASRVVSGVPLHVSPAIADDLVWSIPRDRVLIALRQDATVVSDASAYFSSDRTGVRATLRIGFGFLDPAAVSKIATTP